VDSIIALVGILYVLIFGGLGSYVANEKHRHWAEGFVFGALMGPLGVIAAACMPTVAIERMPPRRPREEEQELDVDQLAERLRRAPPVAQPRQIFPHVS
jgi:hypothetical protein